MPMVTILRVTNVRVMRIQVGHVVLVTRIIKKRTVVSVQVKILQLAITLENQNPIRFLDVTITILMTRILTPANEPKGFDQEGQSQAIYGTVVE